MLSEKEEKKYFKIKEISKCEFERGLVSFTSLKDSDDYPRLYYSIEMGPEPKRFLAYRTDLGLGEPYCIRLENAALFVVVLSFKAYVIDLVTCEIKGQLDLTSPCVEMFFKNEKLIFICEINAVEYCVKAHKSAVIREFPDTVVKLKDNDFGVTVFLSNGQSLLLAY